MGVKRKSQRGAFRPCRLKLPFAMQEGQMTVQLMMVLPVLIIVAVVTVNALLFFGECAAFDALFRDAVRTCATSPAAGQDTAQCQAQVQSALAASFTAQNLEVQVSAQETAGSHVRYTATLYFAPTLFGMGLRSSVLGVAMPRLQHTCEMTVERYKPGILF